VTAHKAAGRANQKLRTLTAIVQAAAELSGTGREVTMPRDRQGGPGLGSHGLPLLPRPRRAACPARGLIDNALAPQEDPLGAADPATVAQLKRGLAVVVSAEAFFSLTDLYGLDPEEAIASIVHTATTLTRAAFQDRADRP